MEGFEEIDEFYEREIERLDREFFDNLKKDKDKNWVVKKYREKLNIARADYQNKYKKFLDNQRKQIQNNKEKILNFKSKINKNFKSFDFQKINFDEVAKKENSKLKKEMFDFRLDLKFRNIHDRIPNPILIFYIKTKFLFKRTVVSFKKISMNFFQYLKEGIIRLVNIIREIFIKIYTSIKKVALSIPEYISKFKKKKKTEEKKDEKPESNNSSK